MVENLDEKIQYGGQFGLISPDSIFWDDGTILQNEIMNYKIIKIKIYYNSKTANEEENKKGKEEQGDENAILKETKEKDEFIEEKYIVGICLVYKNLYTGEIREIEHKGTNNILGMKELNIKGNEYLKYFNINFKNNLKQISQISFCTNKNNSITVGIKDGEDKQIELNKKDNYFKRINAVGCIYTEKKFFIKKYLFGFFLLRKFYYLTLILVHNHNFLVFLFH
jgi:hypothetical protein